MSCAAKWEGSWVSGPRLPLEGGILSVPRDHRGSEGAKCHSTVTGCVTEEVDSNWEETSPGILYRRGSRGLGMKTDLTKITGSQERPLVSLLHTGRPHGAFVVNSHMLG